MKNKKFMAAVLVLSMMLMGAGYAAWTQDFTVTANVDTGELDYVVAGDADSFVLSSSYVEAAFSEESTDDTVVVELDDVYPGASVEFTVAVENTGTVGIQFAEAGEAVDVDLDNDDVVDCTIEVIETSGDTDVAPEEFDYVSYKITMSEESDNDTELKSGVVSIPVTYKQFNQ